MSIRRLSLPILALVAVVVSGCKIDTINYFPPHPANVDVANFVQGPTSIDFTANGTVAWPALPFSAVGAPQQYPNDQASTFTFRAAGGTADLASTGGLNLVGEGDYTLIAYGSTTSLSPGILVVGGTTITAGGGTFQARFANVAGLSSNVDVYITGPNDTIDNTNPRFTNLGYAGLTGYIGNNSGAARIWVTRTTTNGTKPVIYDSGPISLPDAAVATLVIYSVGSATLPDLAMIPLDGSAQQLYPNTLAQFKFVNAAPQSQSVRVLVDGQVVETGLAYPAVTPPTTSTLDSHVDYYIPTTTGTHTVSFEAEATPGASLASINASLAAGSDNTVLLSGNAGSNTATKFNDVNLTTGGTNVRFINATPDVPAIQIVANDAVVVPSLAQNTASGYLTFVPGTFTFVIKDATTGAVLGTVAGATLNSGETDSLYVVGAGSAPGIMFARDR